MNHADSRGHSVTAEINVPWRKAFDFLQQPLKLGQWALGSWDARATEESGVYYGTSLFNGEKTFFRIEAKESLRLIDYFVGDRTALQPRISARIIPGPQYGNNDAFCLVTLDAWRDLGMNDERWRLLCSCHETEILLLKALIEREE